MTQNNMGFAFYKLGEREHGTKSLEQAMNAYKLAIKIRTRERFPLDWAMTQNNMGLVLFLWGVRQNDLEKLKTALACIEGAQKVYLEAGDSQHKEYFFEKINEINNKIRQLG
jgi:hypothetical protein